MTDFSLLMEPVALRLLGKPNVALSKPPKNVRYGTNGSLSIDLTSGTFFDHENNVGGGVLDLIQLKLGCDHDGAVSWLREQGLLAGSTSKLPTSSKPKSVVDDSGQDSGQQPASKTVAAQYEYRDEAGNLVFVVERVEFQDTNNEFILSKGGKRKKTFRQKRPDPDRPGEWIWNVAAVPALIYRLPELIAEAAEEHTILVVEGEAKVDLLRSWNVPATCCAGGARKWKVEHAEYLRNADVVLVPDNDESGWKHANEVGASLVGIASRIRVLVLPGLPPKGDIIDWAKAGGTREQLDSLVGQAPEWQPSAGHATAFPILNAEGTAREDELLAALANMPPGVAFARRRREVAKDLGVRQDAIDDELAARRVEKEAAPLHGHWIVEPWEEPVDGDSLLRDIIRCLSRYVILTFEDALAIALWIVLVWCHEEAVHSPILNVTSAEPESGKSTVLGIVAHLAPKALNNVDISQAALYRSIKQWQPTFVIDEFDSVLSSQNENRQELASVVNSGHTRGQCVIRCIADRSDNKNMPEAFSTFGPKAIGMIGRKMPPATLSRCIFVEMRRRKSSEPIERFKHEDTPELASLRRRLRRWSMDNSEAIGTTEPAMPPQFDNRRADNWRMQFAIADLCGGPEEWGVKAREAAIKLEGRADNLTSNGQALRDAWSIFHPKDDDGQTLEPLERISSADLAGKLAAYPDSPWAEWKGGKPITQAQLARLLKPFGIAPQLIRLPGGTVIRGYQRGQFQDMWERHPPQGVFKALHRYKPA